MKIRMTIHRALAELKMYDKKISDLRSKPYICASKKRATKIYGMTPEELQVEMKSNLQSMMAILRNRQILKTAIAESNERTIVVIGGQEMSVLEAIERKGFLDTYKNVINSLKVQQIEATNVLERYEIGFQAGLEKYINGASGTAGITPELVQTLTESYKNLNEVILIDPCNLKEVISEMEEYVTNFTTEVDYALSESNATTLIEVDLVG